MSRNRNKQLHPKQKSFLGSKKKIRQAEFELRKLSRQPKKRNLILFEEEGEKDVQS